MVFNIADEEKTNAKRVISASNILATKILINCDKATPITKPTANEIIPIKNVSHKRILEI